LIKFLTVIIIGLILAGIASGQMLELNQIIDSVYIRDSLQKSRINDLVISAESYQRKLDSDGNIKEEKKFDKTIYSFDTLYFEEYLTYFKNGEKQSDSERDKEAEKIREKQNKGESRNASTSPLEIFYPDKRSGYSFSLVGIEAESECECYHVRAKSKVDKSDFFDGDFWFDHNTLRPVLVEFRPAKMPGPIKELEMSLAYDTVASGIYLPARFNLRGRGKALWVFGFHFGAEELYSGYRINTGAAQEFFGKEKNHENQDL